VPDADADVMRSWGQICTLEAEDLKNESYGAELLHAVGATYVAKARYVRCNMLNNAAGADQVLARRQYNAQRESFLGVGGFFHGIKGSYHTFTET
jgi:hypothetical protein